MKTVYIKETKDQFLKYQVSYDEEKLSILEEEILTKCCPVVHRVITSTCLPDSNEWIRNVRKGRQVGIQSYKPGWNVAFYEYQYDEYLPSRLVMAIHNLLSFKEVSFGSLSVSSNQVTPLEKIRQQIKELSLEIDQITNLDAETKMKKIIQLKQLSIILKTNEHLVPEKNYYRKVSDLVTIELLGTLEKQQVETFFSFFENSITMSEFTDRFRKSSGKIITKRFE